MSDSDMPEAFPDFVSGPTGDATPDEDIRRSDQAENPSNTVFKYIGHGHRWYDPVYIVLQFFQYSRLGRRLPTGWRRRFYYMSNYLVQFNAVQRMRAGGGSKLDGPLNLPEDEHVTIPGIWVVDYFPPSLIDDLDKAIRHNHWDFRPHIGMGESNKEELTSSRRGQGRAWWRITDIAQPRNGHGGANDGRGKLPREFSAVELKGVPIGEGITAVIAFFPLSKSGSAIVDEVWHDAHEPALARSNDRLVVAEDKRWVAFRQTQAARAKLHGLARTWLQSRCPGAFAQSQEEQPVMDFLLLDQFDPFVGENVDRETEDCMRALGLTESKMTWQTSLELPGLLLERSNPEFTPALQGGRTWALWGNRDSTMAKNLDFKHYGISDQSSALAHYVDDRMGDLVVRLGLSEFLDLLKAESALMRDGARTQHGKFGRKDLERLRRRFLTASLDFSSIELDVRQYNSRRWRDREALFVLDYTPWMRRSDEEAGCKTPKPVQVNKVLRKRQNKAARDLVVFDRSYREILSTVASIGASIDAFKIQRYAVWIAVSSAILALVSLLVSLSRSF